MNFNFRFTGPRKLSVLNRYLVLKLLKLVGLINTDTSLESSVISGILAPLLYT